jgi:hypothetical protein
MNKTHAEVKLDQRKFLENILLLFLLGLLLTACQSSNSSVSLNMVDSETPAVPISEVTSPEPEIVSVEDQPNQVDNGVISPTAVIEPEQQALLDQATETLSENEFYGLEVSLTGEDIVAHSPLDAADSPHYNYVEGEWIDNHPGRNAMEAELFPPVLEDGMSIWENLERDGAVWDQEMMAYHYVGSPDADPDHEQYYQPLMAVTDSDLKDIEQGKVNFSERIQSTDYEPGVSGVKIDFFISDNHEHIKWWENLPQELASQIYAEMYLEKFPSLRGKHVQVRVVAEDKTGRNDRVRPETFFQGDSVDFLDEFSTGIIDSADDLKIATLTISDKNIEFGGVQFASSSHSALIWALIIERDGKVISGDHDMDSQLFENEARASLMSESGLLGLDTVNVKIK